MSAGPAERRCPAHRSSKCQRSAANNFHEAVRREAGEEPAAGSASASACSHLRALRRIAEDERRASPSVTAICSVVSSGLFPVGADAAPAARGPRAHAPNFATHLSRAVVISSRVRRGLISKTIERVPRQQRDQRSYSTSPVKGAM